MRNKIANRALNLIGGIPDILMKNFPTGFARRENPVGRDEYLSGLEFYARENWGDKKFLYLPYSAPQFDELVRRPFMDGTSSVLRYPSRYQVQNPAVAEEFNKYKANLSGYLHIWRHDKTRERPLVLCLHGFMMGFPQQAMRMFKIRKLYEMGTDVGLYVQPHHWKRLDKPPHQHLLDPENVPLTIETFGQNIHDLHSAVLLLKSFGYKRIGLIGASLGGYTSALYATFDAPVDFMFAVVPALDFKNFLNPKKAKFSFRMDSEIENKTSEALDIITPLSYMPTYDVNKICVVMHSGDKLAEASIARRWIKKWSIPNYVEVVGGHWLYFDKNARGETWYGWLREMGYVD